MIYKELEVCPTKELINELQKRFEHMVFVGRKKSKSVGNDYIQRWNGDLVTCIGLCSMVKLSVLDDLNDQMKPI